MNTISTTNDLKLEVVHQARALWQRRWLVTAVAWSAALVAALAVWFVPNRFEATAKVYVDTQTVLKPLMAGLAFQPDIDQQVRMLGRTLITRPNIERLLGSLDGVAKHPNSEEFERSIDRLIDKIKVDGGGGNLYLISYRDVDPERAKSVVSGLVNIFVDSGADAKQKDSQDASRFIDEQIKAYEGKLAAAENKLKDFKVRNFGLSGVSNQDYFARMSALSDEVGRLRVALVAAEQSRDTLKRELSQEDPLLPVEPSVATVPPAIPSELEVRIDTQRRQLDELLRRFTDEHPDVRNTRRIVAQLEQQHRVEIERQTRASSTRSPAGNAATSPVFQKIRIALAEAEANIASLRTQLSAQQRRLDENRATASRVPQAEAELAQLNRDYEVMRRNYEQLVSRREAASLGVKIDQSTPMAEFRIVEPPRVSPRPVFPDRRLLATLGAFMSLALGALVAIGMNQIVPTYDTIKSLQETISRPVIGLIGTFRDLSAQKVERMDSIRFGLSAFAFLFVNSVWIVLASRLGAFA